MKARVIAFLIILATVGFALPFCKKINPEMFWIYLVYICNHKFYLWI